MRAEAVVLIAISALAHPSYPRSVLTEDVPATGPVYQAPANAFTSNVQPNFFAAISRKRKFDEETALLSANSKKQHVQAEVEVKRTLELTVPPPCVCENTYDYTFEPPRLVLPTKPGQTYCDSTVQRCKHGHSCVMM
jgi:hypothetical protein